LLPVWLAGIQQINFLADALQVGGEQRTHSAST